MWLEIFFKRFESFWIFCRNLWHGSQISIYLSRVKIAEGTVFWFFFSDFFSDFERKVFQTFGQKTSKVVKTTLYVSRGTVCGLKFFSKVLNRFRFMQKPSAWFSNFYPRVQSKNCGRNSFLIFLFRIFSAFERIIFQTFGEKSSKSCQNYLLGVQRNNLWLEIFFRSFDSFWIFCRNLWHGSQLSIYVSRVKTAEKIVCFCFLFRIFFRTLSENFSDFWPKNFKKFSKLSSTCPEEQFVAWNSSAWFSKLYLRVQSKNFGRNSFLIFLFRIFSDVERNFFQTFGEKSSKSCQNYLLRVQRNNLWLEIFFKRFESFWIFCRNLWHGSQISIYVSRVKIAEETVFWFFFSDFFSDFERKVFQTFGQKTSKSCQNYPLRVQRNSLRLEIFFKFWIVLDFLQKPSAWFSNFYLRVQSKNCGRNSFLIFLFRFFFGFCEKNFSDFRPKNFKSFQNYLLRVQRSHLCL